MWLLFFGAPPAAQTSATSTARDADYTSELNYMFGQYVTRHNPAPCALGSTPEQALAPDFHPLPSLAFKWNKIRRAADRLASTGGSAPVVGAQQGVRSIHQDDGV